LFVYTLPLFVFTLGGVDMTHDVNEQRGATFLMRDVRVLVHHHTLVQLNQGPHTLLASGLIH
jgi:hypothetical protein